jgi:nucleoside-diphosphate-sugar epimerase
VGLSDEKILVTGPAGTIARPLCEYLAADNEVWGIARFSEPGSRELVEAAGVTTRTCDLADGDFSDLPDDFTVVLHLATFLGPGWDFDYALRVNAEGTGLLLQHCRRAKAALVMSTTGVYRPHDDPWHPYVETDPLGSAALPHSPTYPVSKNAEEAVARYCARAFDLPVVIARMNAAYGANGGLPAFQLDWMVAGQPVAVRWDPCPYSPIAQDDINSQVEAVLGVASVPARILNWGGDEAVSPQEWCPYLAELAGVEARFVLQEIPGSQRGVVLDVTRRLAVTGPCSLSWREGMRAMLEARYPDGVTPGQPLDGRALRLLESSAETG